jgi:hypothetical protein
MRHITPLQPNIIRYLVEQNKWTELTNHIMALQSRVGLLEVMLSDQEWQPIETAPKDGTEILATLNYGDGVHHPEVTAFVCNRWVVSNDDDGYAMKYHPTHWMPIRKPPAGF